jgi:hypothetical protein
LIDAGSAGSPPAPHVGFRPIADIPDRGHPAQVTDFADLDPVINKWVEATGSTLFDGSAGRPARFFHLPGEPPFECFQIVVFPPTGNDVTVQAASIDTNDDAEMMQIWEGPAASLDELLGVAVATVEQWRQRPQGG